MCQGVGERSCLSRPSTADTRDGRFIVLRRNGYRRLDPTKGRRLPRGGSMEGTPTRSIFAWLPLF